MSSKYNTRQQKKKSLSEQLDIGAGRYVHNVEYSSLSPVENEMAIARSSLSSKKVGLSWNHIDESNETQYVNKADFTSLVDLTNGPNRTNNPNDKSVGVSLRNQSDNIGGDISTNVNNNNGVTISNVAKGSTISTSKNSDSPNFTKLHEEYKKQWRLNPPSNETRPMRLLEFIWSRCDGKRINRDPDYYSDDTLNQKLKKSAAKRGTPLRELFAEKDEEYESALKAKESRYEYLSDTNQNNSLKSNLSEQSLVDYFDKKNDFDKPFDLDDSSLSSCGTNDNEVVVLSDKSQCENETSKVNDITNKTNKTITLFEENNNGNMIVSISKTLHIPDGFNELYYNSDSDEVKSEKLKRFDDYLTDSLKEELSKYYPQSDSIRRDPLTNDIFMDKEKFSSNFSKMFPKERVFINIVQLRQAVQLFFKHWNLLCKNNGKNIRCSYSHTPGTKKCTPDNSKNLNDSNRQSTSSLVQCPFQVKWTLVDHKKPYRHEIFYRVKISTIVSTEHTCMMSHISFRHALKKSNGHNKIDLNIMNTAVSILKVNPSMPANMLRPLLKDCLPCHTNIDAKFVDNFRRRVALHHAKNPNQPMLSIEECKALSKHQDLTTSDYVGMNDPLVRTNLNAIYGKIMENDHNVWSALKFLKECKETIPGFDFRILRGKAGNPTALLYMTSRMRYNLIRFGNIMFIDAQKRKYNKLNWPYIGPVIKNSDNRIGVTCEAIVTTEDIDTYTWIFKSMVSIEPRWSVSRLQILYGDGLVSKKLLENLGISHSCILHGDFYHLFKENWPKPENFGISIFRIIKPHLYKMLLSKTVAEWDNAFNEASNKLIGHPVRLDLLRKIHADPDYYAGYVTRKIVGNLSCNGTAPSEQNHASIVACNGNNMLGSICEHLKALCERQQQICNKENDYETDHLIRTNHYKPTLDGEMACEELVAKQALSDVPHRNYFVKQLKSSESLQSLFDDRTQCYKVWPAGSSFDKDDDDHVVIHRGGRCSCWRRIDYDIQCKHELRISPKFNVNHWASRWYNRREFNKRFPNMSTFENNPEVIYIEDNDNNTNLNAVDDKGNDVQGINEVHHATNKVVFQGTDVMESSNNSVVFNSILENANSKVTYSDVLEIATDLCRTVSDNPKLCRSTYGTIFEWITRLREGKDFEISFNNKALPNVSDTTARTDPLPAVVTPAGSSRKKRQRYKSSEELRQRNFKTQKTQYSNVDIHKSSEVNRMYKGMSKSNIDEYFVGIGASDKKYCYLCRQPKCTRWTCNVLKSYEKLPGRILPKGNQEARDKLINLISTVDNHVLCHNRSKDDKRIIHNELPSKMKALVVHKKFIIEDSTARISPHDNVCIECTILGDLGIPISDYSEALFSKHCITRRIGKSKNNLVVDNLS